MTTPARHDAPADLDKHHRKTYEALFRHPTAHNLEWHDVRSLLNAVADVVEGHDGDLVVTRNGFKINLHTPKHKDLNSYEELQTIRQFLDHSRVSSIEPPVVTAADQLVEPVATGADLLVVIDHHEAKVYRSERRGAVPKLFVPYDPYGHLRHLRTEDPETDGKRKPERKSYYEAIAKTLRGAERILVFGSGTGESSAMQRLVAELERHHGDLARLVVGTVLIDANHLTEGELLAKAREFFSSRP